ncbi:MAG TPA: hypothetical protein VM095_16680 [Pyrinomonadaceae bacterium]|nr:hypothetical protein [Pyrinomonadaceae bacterium]
MRKNFFVAALALIALTSISALNARAQSSCPIGDTFGTRQLLAVDKNLQSQIEVTYFTTNDPNAFLSEKAGLSRSGSYLNVNTNQFVAKLGGLERDGLASIRAQRSMTSYLGETAELNLGHDSINAQGRMINASHASANPTELSALDRKTEINVYEGRPNERGYYRVSLLSWFVDAAKARGGQRVVDYDAIVLLKPGQTAVFKLASSYETKRSGAARSYVAVTMRSVNNTSLASLGRRP